MRHGQVKAIVNGTVYTPDEVIASGVVLIEENTITAVGSAGTTPVPPEAKLIEAGGMAVVPGLIDVLGLHKGRLAPGYDADVVLLNEALRLALTIVGGEEVFRREGVLFS